MNCIFSTLILLQYIQVTPTSYHAAHFKLLDRNSLGKFGDKSCDDDYKKKQLFASIAPDIFDRINRMKDKEMCAVHIKPETKIGYFSLKKPKLLRFKERKIDFNPKEKSNTPRTIKRQFNPDRYSTGICI